MNVVYNLVIENLAKELKVESNVMKNAWSKSWANVLKLDLSAQPVVTVAKAVKAKAEKTEKPKVKRAKSAYNFFCEEERKRLNQEFEGKEKPKSNDVLNMINKNWKSLSEEDKKPYVEMAQQAKAVDSEDEEKQAEPRTVKAAEPKAKKAEPKANDEEKQAEPRTVKAAEPKAKKAEPKANDDEQVVPVQKAEKKKKAKKDEENPAEPYQKAEKKKKAEGFNFETEKSVAFDDKKWWKVSTMEVGEEEFKYHRLTNLIFAKQDDDLILHGRLVDGEVVLREDLPETVLEWCKKSNIQFEQEEQEALEESEVDALFDEDN